MPKNDDTTFSLSPGHNQAKSHYSSDPAYAELVTTSNFTFLHGGSHPEELVEQAAHLGYRAIAVTDVNTLAGIVRAHTAAREAGIQLIVAARLRLTVDHHAADARAFDIAVYPTNLAAYGRLCRLLTLGKRRAEKGECHLALHDLLDHHEGLLAVAIPLMWSTISSFGFCRG